MSRFTLIAHGVDTLPLALELARNETLWDANPFRRVYPDSPHRDMTDIIARYMPGEVTRERRMSEHRNVFWPAWHALPSLRPLVFGLMARVQAVELGSVLITRLPPGKSILPHNDVEGGWAPAYYNCKGHLTVTGSAVVTCDGEECEFLPGTVWWFDNLLMHSIANNGDDNRVCVIVSMRCD